jgi:hypothetical protein
MVGVGGTLLDAYFDKGVAAGTYSGTRMKTEVGALLAASKLGDGNGARMKLQASSTEDK